MVHTAIHARGQFLNLHGSIVVQRLAGKNVSKIAYFGVKWDVKSLPQLIKVV